MLIIEDKTIKINRGDSGSIKLKIPISDTQNYIFNINDKIQFRIFEKNGYDKETVLNKEIIVNSQTDEINIELTENDTTIGNDINKPVKYWYEISLNESQTVVGYDEDGAAEFILYPAKGGK